MANKSPITHLYELQYISQTMVKPFTDECKFSWSHVGATRPGWHDSVRGYQADHLGWLEPCGFYMLLFLFNPSLLGLRLLIGRRC